MRKLITKYKLSAIVPAAVLMLALAACQPAVFSAGGWVESAAKDGSKANFGGEVNACDLSNPYGHFTYHDKNATGGSGSSAWSRLRIEGDVVEGAECVEDGDLEEGFVSACEKCMHFADGFEWDDNITVGAAKLTYRSQDKKNNPGNGSAYVCVTDGGEGANAYAPDMFAILVTSGPYMWYENHGEVQGNVNFDPDACL